MAFKRYAKALTAERNIHFDKWVEELRTQASDAIPEKHVIKTAKEVLTRCDPKQYLLSHATIVASVDTYTPKIANMGRGFDERGMEIDVRFADFRIKPDCLNIINNNGDAWERSLLMSTYKTFVGAPNYLEHIQLPALSKGFIVDAIARDIGNSCYIDILVATDRKHNQLVNDILSGEMQAMSMGCHKAGTKVTMGDGSLLNIEDIRPDMEVLTQQGNVKRVENLQIRENRWTICKVKAVGLPIIESTDNHGYYVIPQSELEFRKNTKRKLVPVNKDYDLTKIDLGKVNVGDIIATPILQGEIETKISESDAYMIGLFAADGWKFDNTHDSTVGVGFNIDKNQSSVIDFLTKKIEQVMFVSKEDVLTACGHSCNRGANISEHRNAKYINSTSRSLRNLIDDCVYGRTAKTKIFNNDVLYWPKNLQKHLLAGYIDGDGSVSTNKRGTKSLHISSRNHDLLNQLQIIASRNGFITSISKAKRNGTKLVPNGNGTDYQLNFMNNGISAIPSHKIQSNIIKESVAGLTKRWITDKYLYTTITSIEKSDFSGFVYDLEVDDDHTYVANGIGVSNCISLFTICTRCGNVAVDDSQICSHVAYDGKLTPYIDEDGVEHRLGELIGHVTVPNSNQFIEASWVRNPAFKGAVRRNLLNADHVANNTQFAVQFDTSANVAEFRNGLEFDVPVRAASVQVPARKYLPSLLRIAEEMGADSDTDSGSEGDSADLDMDLDIGDLDSESEDSGSDDSGSEDPPVESDSKNKIQELADKVREQVLEIVVNDLDEILQPDAEDVGVATPPSSVNSLNDNILSTTDYKKLLKRHFSGHSELVEWATSIYQSISKNYAGRKRILSSLSPQDLIKFSWINDVVSLKTYPASLYQTVMAVGPAKGYPSRRSFLAACSIHLKRSISESEKEFLIHKGRIASQSNKF